MTTFISPDTFTEAWDVPGAVLGAPRYEVELVQGDNVSFSGQDATFMGRGAMDMSFGSFADRDREVADRLANASALRQRHAIKLGQSAVVLAN